MVQSKRNQVSRRNLLAGAGAVVGGASVVGTAGRTAAAPNVAGADGPVRILPGDRRYDGLVRGNNFRFVGRPDEIRVVSSTEAVRLARTSRPDVILMDLRMPGLDGVTATRELAALEGGDRVLVLTTHDTDSHVLPAIEAGASGYLLKDEPRDELLRAVRATARGEAVLAPSAAALLMSRVREPAPGPLSRRELEVLHLVAAGATNREAAAELFITEATIKSHLLTIYTKLGVSDRAAAVTEAFHRRLLIPRAPELP